MMAAQKAKIVFGAMTFGKEGAEQARVYSIDTCGKILDVFQRFGYQEIDTARTYGGGSSETYLGQLEWQKRGLVMDTKLSPASEYSHSPADLRRGLLDSLKALQAKSVGFALEDPTVDMWYLHRPDRTVPYEDTLREVNQLYKEGYFRRFGISNFTAWETAQVCEICSRNGWKKPDVYQGVYNALHRAVEPELFPCLRRYGIAFYAYNPLAGGILTDRYQRDNVSHEEGSRFDPNRSQGTQYRGRYWNETYFDALDSIRPAANKLGMSTAEASLRWAVHHSEMRADLGDAIIIGASSVKQLEENLANFQKDPLPDEMVQAFDQGWSTVKGVCAAYFK